MELPHRHEPLLPSLAHLAAGLTALALLAAPAVLGGQEPAPPPAAPTATPAAPGPVPATPGVRPAAPTAPQEAGFLGVAIDDVGAERAEELGLSEPRGALVTEVMDDSPASRAGLQADDVVLAWDGESVRSALHLRRLVRETPPGRKVSVTLLRDGDRRAVDLTVDERPGSVAYFRTMEGDERRELEARLKEAREHARDVREEARHRAREARQEAREVRREAVRFAAHAGPRIGVHLFSLNDQLAEYFGLDEERGALVVRVEEDSPAGAAGLRAGDVMIAVDGTEVGSPSDAARLIRDAAGETVEISVIRRGEERSVSVEVPEGAAAGPRSEGREVRLRLRRMGPEIRAALEEMERPLRDLGPQIGVMMEDLGPRIHRLVPDLLGRLDGGRLII